MTGTATRAQRAAIGALRKLELEHMHESAEKACVLLKAMANESRLMILCQLARGEMSVSELQDFIGLSQSALSQHLAILRERQLVTTRRDGQQIYYSLASGEAAAVIRTLYQQYCAPSGC